MTSPSPASVEPISAADRERAKELYTKATSGPWCAYDYASEGIPEEYCICAVGEIVRGNVTASLRENDAEFIAFARTAVPSYEARVVELEAALVAAGCGARVAKNSAALMLQERERFAREKLAAEASATALLEALRLISEWAPLRNSAKKKANVVPLTEFQHGFNCAVKGIGDFACAAINAGASNDRK